MHAGAMMHEDARRTVISLWLSVARGRKSVVNSNWHAYATAIRMKPRRNIFAFRRLNKLVAIFLLVFEGIFLNVIIPGHTRGAITLSGKENVGCAADLGCPFCSPVKKESKQVPSDKDRSECAICNFAALLSVPPVVDFVPPLTGVARAVELAAPARAPLVRVQVVIRDRAPPVVA
jgi:hypothetical protein